MLFTAVGYSHCKKMLHVLNTCDFTRFGQEKKRLKRLSNLSKIPGQRVAVLVDFKPLPSVSELPACSLSSLEGLERHMWYFSTLHTERQDFLVGKHRHPTGRWLSSDPQMCGTHCQVTGRTESLGLRYKPLESLHSNFWYLKIIKPNALILAREETD